MKAKTYPHTLFAILLLSTAAFLHTSCTSEARNPETGDNASPKSAESTSPSAIIPEAEKAPGFNEYWYQGKAELTRYSLQQARYGEIHRGEAVTIFVTEDFDMKMQVKAASKGEPILKLNFNRKFNTGLYPYSILSSVFNPIDPKKPHAIKATTSVEEWCGHAYLQVNNRDGKYESIEHSYFPNEGDQRKSIKVSLLEDEIWNLIRINPKRLPTGDISLIPPLHHIRLMHLDTKNYDATATLNTGMGPNGQTLKIYQIEYKDLKRSLTITFDEKFPFTILSWEEKYPSGFGPGKKMLTTRGERQNSMMLDYWSKNAVADSVYRQQLGLTF